MVVYRGEFLFLMLYSSYFRRRTRLLFLPLRFPNRY